MKIVHVFQCFGQSCGISVFCAELMKNQIEAGHDCWIVNETVREYALDKRIRKLTSRGTLDVLGFTPDVVHVHSVWSPFAARAIAWCVRHRVKFVVSPHGCLMPRVMGKGWLKKHVFYWVFLKKNLQLAWAIHCTGDGEVAAVKDLGIRTPIFVAPLGCHLPEWPIKRIASGKKTILFLSRISEEKGLFYLLDAWKVLPHEGWRLVIAGPDWRGHKQVLENKIRDEQVDGVEFPGVADAEMKDKLYRQSDLFVLPSPMENFSMVVLDALAYGIPVVCTKGTPWKSIQDNDCGWWIESKSVGDIVMALQTGMVMDKEGRGRLGKNARRLAEGFSWRSVGEKVLSHY